MVEEWRRRHLQSVSSDLELPLYVNVSPSATTPSQSERHERHPYIPPSFSSTPRAAGVFESDDAFKYVATSMLLLYENHKLSVEDSIKGILIPEERMAFTEALRYRFSRLPVFPEPGESSLDGLLRRIHGIFGATLESLPNVEQHPAEPTNNRRDVSENVLQGAHFSKNKLHVPQHYLPSNQHSPRRPSPLKAWQYDTREEEDDNDDRERPRSSSRRSRDRFGKSPRSPQKQKSRRTDKYQGGDDYHDDVPKSFVIRPSGSRQARQHFFPESPHHNMRDPPGINTNSPIRVDIDWNIAIPVSYSPRQAPKVVVNTDSRSDVRVKDSDSRKRNEEAHSNSVPEQSEHRLSASKNELTMEARRSPQSGTLEAKRSPHSGTLEAKRSPHSETKTKEQSENEASCNPITAGSPYSQSSQVTAKTKTTSATDQSSEKNNADAPTSNNTVMQPQMSWEVGTTEQSVAKSRQDDATEDSSNKATMTGFMSWVSQALSFNTPATPSNDGPREGPRAGTESVSQPAESEALPVKQTQVIVSNANAEFHIEIARRKGTLWRNEAEALKRQSFLWQDISDEICEVMVKIQNANDDIERQAYESYLEELQAEMQRWGAASAPNERSAQTGSKNLRFDGTDEGKAEDRYSITQNHSDARFSPRQQERGGEPQVALIEPSFERSNRVVSVMAPRALPEGYKFEARIGNEAFLAKVPRGGVSKGEVFASRMYSIYDEDNYPERGSVFKDMDTPDSRWRDELFDCFHHGFLHPFLLNTILCPHVALVQVMSRLQISCTGDRVTKLRGRSRAGNLVLFTFLVIIVHVAYFLYPAYVPVPLDHFLIATMPLIGMDVVLLFYFIYMVAFTRATIRREYGISESRCRGCEDSCMAVFCTCCTIGQMGRHTADYETYRSYCCTDTGLARHIEVMV